MVSKEQAVAQQQKQIQANQEAKAKQDAIIASSKQNRDQNRGYQSESTDRFGNTEVYRESSKTISQDPRALQDNRKVVQAKEDQTKQLQKELSNLSPQNKIAYDKFIEATAKAGDQKSIDQLRKQGRDVITVKQGPYERTYYDALPDDIYKELTTGYKDEKGNVQQNYFINPIKSGEGIRDEPVTFESEAQKVQVDKNVSWSNDRLLEGKTPVSETKWSDQDYQEKSFGIEKSNEFIKNRNEIALQNQKVVTDFFIEEGKKLGFKDVKITKDGKTEIVPLGDKKLYDFSSSMEFTFVKTPEMIAETKQIRQDQKSFVESAKKLGYKEIKIKTPTETKIVPVEQGYREIIKSGVAEISLIRTPEMIAETKQIRKEQKEFVKSAKESGIEFLIVGKDVVPIEQGYREIVKAKDVNVSTVQKPYEEPEISQDGFSQALKRFNKDPYAPPDIVPAKNIENIPENKIYHERKTDLPFSDKVKHGSDVFFANLGGMISGAYNQALPGYDKLVNKLTGNYDKNKISFEQLPVAPSRLLYVPESVVGAQTSAIAVSALEAKDFEDFINKTGVRQQDVYQMLSDQPTERTLGQIGGFIAPFFVTKSTLKAIPLRYTKTPIYTVLSPYASNYYSRSLRLGYDRFNLLIGQKYGLTGKISLGKAKPELSGIYIIKGTESKSSFDTYQIGSFTKTQRQDFNPGLKYLEETGIVGKGDLDKVDQIANIIKKTEKKRSIIDILTKRNIQPKEVTQTFGRTQDPITKQVSFEERLEPEKTIDLISELQKKKMISERGGSTAFNLYKTQPQRIIGDWDFDLLKDKAIVFAKIFDAKITKPGYSLFAKGSNIITGKTDFNAPFWNLLPTNISKGKTIRGTSQKFGTSFIKNPEPANLPRGEVFASNAPSIANRFAKRASKTDKSKPQVLDIDVDMSKILQYGKLSKKQRRESAYDSQGKKLEWYEFQENLKQLALKEGKLGYTKPYMSTVKDAPKYEVVIFGKEAIKGVAEIKPSGYGIVKGTESDFLNLLTDKDQAKSIVKGLSDKFFGDKFKTKTVRQTAPSGRTITTHDLFSQMKKLSLANSQILDEGALKFYRGDATPFAKLFEKSRIRVGFGTLGRLSKDTASNYFFGMRLLAEASFKSGNKALAKEIGSVMKMEYEKQKAWGFNWQNEIAKIKESPVTIVKGKKDYGLSEKISSGAKSTFAKSPIITGYSEQYKTPSESMTSKFSTKSQKSIASIKPKSISMKSVSPSIKSISMKSAKSPSIKSTSMKSASMKSVSSSLKSVSPKSFSMKSPSMKSVVSPKIPSSKSPSIKSPSLKSPSLGSPNIKSPSLKSPSLSFPILKTPPTRTLLLPGIMKFGKHKKGYGDIPKHSLTFRWSVKNPVFKKFSINEGKRRKIEW